MPEVLKFYRLNGNAIISREQFITVSFGKIWNPPCHRLENSQFTSSNNGPTTDDVDETFAPSSGSASAMESFTPSGGMELPVSTASQPWKNETTTAVKDEKKE